MATSMAAVADEPAPKRQKQKQMPSATAFTSPQRPAYLPRDPLTVVSWNANGLAPRAKIPSNLEEFRRLLRATGLGSSDTGPSTAAAAAGTINGSNNVCPDIICIQEARLKRAPASATAGGAGAGGQPDAKEMKEIQPFLRITQTAGYETVWSLADGRKAGTLTLVHKRLLPSAAGAGTNRSGLDMIRKNFCAFTLDGALSLMLASYGLQDASDLKKLVGTCGSGSSSNNDNSSSGSKSSGAQKQKNSSSSKQSSMMAFMVKQSSTGPTAGKSSSSTSSTMHDAEGRMQYLRFANLDILHTYSPNNGTKAESHARRRAFDENVRRFLSARQRILERAGDTDRPIMWLGDLNVARTHLDGTHHKINSDGTADEYWTDERRCYANNQAPRGPRSKDDMGIPGFTPNERRRFEDILAEASLVDIWRHLHPKGVTSDALPYLGRHGGMAERNPWDRANYTWRGTMGRNQAVARYQGKGQRIDYFLISRHAVVGGGGDNGCGRVVSCDILGYGEQREGYFCGSDHCPIVLVMKDAPASRAAANGDGICSKDGVGDDDRKLPAKETDAPAEEDIIDLT